MTEKPAYVHDEDGGRAIWSLGALLIVKAGAADTGGAFTLYDSLTAPGVASPWHRHANEDELFYVLDGEVECLWGEGGAEHRLAGPGSTVFLPREVPHGFRVVGDEPCRMLVLLSPGGLEEFFADVGRPADALELPPPTDVDMASVVETAAAYDLDILGRPPFE